MKRKFSRKAAQKSQALWEETLKNTISIMETISRRQKNNKVFRTKPKPKPKPKPKQISFWGSTGGKLKKYSHWRKIKH